MRTYEERFNYELKKMTDRSAQKKFFSGAVDRMNNGYDEKWVNESKDFACEVLGTCGFCLHVPCEACILEAAYLRAIEEIKSGGRLALKEFKTSKSRIGYRISNT